MEEEEGFVKDAMKKVQSNLGRVEYVEKGGFFVRVVMNEKEFNDILTVYTS